MSDAYVFAKGNTAEISLPAGAQVAVKAKTNSSNVQKVQLTSKDGVVDLAFSGTGEGNAPIGQSTVTGPAVLTAAFEFAAADGDFKPSKLNSGGPYTIGAYNLAVVVAENGDDADYNDTVLEFSWHTPK
ncbi:fucose-binding lectin II [Kitasatospora sp. MY 5-36]|uniref:fucose-binding lectin II n=1 Tax=Kitasatospora sp. MY 5-36 TaxID=1678027 RepID=UPI0006710CEB|nr:fucose-binding lectin II [Kitasatospora sp. MY 5-36]